MGDVLKDFRGKITPEAWVVIEAEHRATGEDHSAIVRAVLHGWALRELTKSSVMQQLAKSEGIAGNVGELT